jgi:hypothetical protein
MNIYLSNTSIPNEYFVYLNINMSYIFVSDISANNNLSLFKHYSIDNLNNNISITYEYNPNNSQIICSMDGSTVRINIRTSIVKFD